MDYRHRNASIAHTLLFIGTLSLLISGCAVSAPSREAVSSPGAGLLTERVNPAPAKSQESPHPLLSLEDRARQTETAPPQAHEEDPADDGSMDAGHQDLIDQAIELCEHSRGMWDAGNTEAALDALDKAYLLIKSLGPDAPPELLQQKDDLRFTVSKRIVEIYSARHTAVRSPHTAIPLVKNSHVNEAISVLTGREGRFFLEAYRLSGRYRPQIVSALSKAGLPEELSWLPLIESGFKTRALSQARALGLWQFIPSTGYKYGLKRTRWVDERMDPDKSTRAAIAYLKELHQIFGDWTTALAAYNCGEGAVLKKIQSQKINYLDNFWDLYQSLPRETAQYVPRFLAVLHILTDPEAYGLSLPEPESPIEFEEAEIQGRTSLKTIARCIGVDLQELAELNPELRYRSTPDRPYTLKVPRGTGETLVARLAETARHEETESEIVVHRVTKGDSLFQLAQSYGTSIEAIMDLNELKNGHFLKVGWNLKIPTGAPERGEAGMTLPGDGVAPVSGRAYRVKKGDSLSKIAGRFKTSTKALQDFNQLPDGGIREGQVLRIPAAATLTIGRKKKDQNV